MTSQWPLGHQAPTDQFRAMLGDASIGWAVAAGVPGFFAPRAFSPLLLAGGGGPEALSFYDTAPLKATLERLVDFDRINAREKRLSVGAVNIRTGNFTYFDNTHQKIGPEHIMASAPCRRAFRRSRSTASGTGTAAWSPIRRSNTSSTSATAGT